jgi:hypothetical protein
MQKINPEQTQRSFVKETLDLLARIRHNFDKEATVKEAGLCLEIKFDRIIITCREDGGCSVQRKDERPGRLNEFHDKDRLIEYLLNAY